MNFARPVDRLRPLNGPLAIAAVRQQRRDRAGTGPCRRGLRVSTPALATLPESALCPPPGLCFHKICEKCDPPHSGLGHPSDRIWVTGRIGKAYLRDCTRYKEGAMPNRSLWNKNVP